MSSEFGRVENDDGQDRDFGIGKNVHRQNIRSPDLSRKRFDRRPEPRELFRFIPDRQMYP